MIALSAQLPSLIALAAHVAICVIGVSLAGAAALWISRGRSAPLRHAMALGFLLATLAVPAIAALYQYRLIRSDFVSPPQAIGRTITAIPNAGPVAAPVEEPAAAGTRPDNGPNWSFIACTALALVWGAGIAIGCVRALLLNRRQRQYLASLRPVTDAEALELADQLRGALGIERHVLLRSSRDAPWPFTVGLFRPIIVIPGELLHEELRSRLEAVLIHELAHVLRLDCGIAGIEGLARLIFWWNPLVTALASQLAAAREEICDGYVLAHSGDGAPLAQYLMRSVEKAARAQIRFAVGLSSHHPHSLRQRITQLLAGDRNTMIRISPLAAYALVIAVFVLALAVTHGNYAHAQLQFGPVVNAGPLVNTSVHEDPTAISSDGLTLYFNRGASVGPVIEMYRAQRESVDSPWTTVTPVSELNTPRNDFGIRYVSTDHLTAFYSSEGHAPSANNRILQSTRISTAEPWGAGVVLPSPVDAPNWDSSPSAYANGLRIIFDSERPGGSGQLDLWEAQRSSMNDPWIVNNLGAAINTSSIDRAPYVSRDGLMLFFASDRLGGFGDADIWLCQRASIDEPWNPPTNLGPSINNEQIQSWPVYWSEGMTLIFRSNGHGGSGGNDIFSAAVIPEPSRGSLFLSAGVLLAALFFTRAKRILYGSRFWPVAPFRLSSSADRDSGKAVNVCCLNGNQ